ncbi:glycosyltransferase [Helicobacter cetorum]|uniref:glycosyltransferase n=1 Tax=Helicobacter cetorum TaxID=138563 RepID=UPI001F345E7D|nr:glycosyltransferase [Helicobacter cetorum]
MSNYYKAKGQDFVLRAFYLSKCNIPLIFIGNFIENNTLIELQALKLKLDKKHGYKEVYFFQKIQRESVCLAFLNATLFLHASIDETFPMVILECLEHATPYCCTDVGNVRSYLKELLVNTEQEMGEKINALLSDPSYYESVSKKLHEIVKNYTYESIAKEFLKDIE